MADKQTIYLWLFCLATIFGWLPAIAQEVSLAQFQAQFADVKKTAESIPDSISLTKSWDKEEQETCKNGKKKNDVKNHEIWVKMKKEREKVVSKSKDKLVEVKTTLLIWLNHSTNKIDRIGYAALMMDKTGGIEPSRKALASVVQKAQEKTEFIFNCLTKGDWRTAPGISSFTQFNQEAYEKSYQEYIKIFKSYIPQIADAMKVLNAAIEAAIAVNQARLNDAKKTIGELQKKLIDLANKYDDAFVASYSDWAKYKFELDNQIKSLSEICRLIPHGVKEVETADGHKKDVERRHRIFISKANEKGVKELEAALADSKKLWEPLEAQSEIYFAHEKNIECWNAAKGK